MVGGCHVSLGPLPFLKVAWGVGVTWASDLALDRKLGDLGFEESGNHDCRVRGGRDLTEHARQTPISTRLVVRLPHSLAAGRFQGGEPAYRVERGDRVRRRVARPGPSLGDEHAFGQKVRAVVARLLRLRSHLQLGRLQHPLPDCVRAAGGLAAEEDHVVRPVWPRGLQL